MIDEFHVLFTGNDETAERAAALLEEISRKGRSYGVHLILASQSVSGIEALIIKGSSIFGQFGLRIAMAGGGGVLEKVNNAADSLPIGQAVVNDRRRRRRRGNRPHPVPGRRRGRSSRGCGTRSGSCGRPAARRRACSPATPSTASTRTRRTRACRPASGGGRPTSVARSTSACPPSA